MSVLPSPIPHPLDYCPWDLPGWIYEALDWVVGVEWPEGNERAVWDLADHWYGVAAVLAGPRDDAVSAAAQVRSGYGGVGAVAEAFDSAWRRVAEGDDAPLPVLLTLSGELGQLVESCGCDIEGAKLEAWIELGILVVELLSLAVATVLTAGAASPAAGVAITTTRMVVQQIFKRLMAQLVRKALKEGLKEAGERAAKEVVKSGVRGLARRAALGGLAEAGEEAGVSLATQAYQNSTGRRHGLDVIDLGRSAVGGFAGGAVAPLAGLGPHANGRLRRIGEHFGREMTGETLAEAAAGLASGQGVSLEDLARAAVSGTTGAATSQADTALHHRLDGTMDALAGASSPARMDLAGLSLAVGSGSPEAGTQGTTVPSLSGAAPPDSVVSAAEPGQASSFDTVDARTGPLPGSHPVTATAVSPVDVTPAQGAVTSEAPLIATAEAARPAVDPSGVDGATSPTLSSVAVESTVAAPHLSVTGDPGLPPVHSGAPTSSTPDADLPPAAVQPSASSAPRALQTPPPLAAAAGGPASMSAQPALPAPAPIDRKSAAVSQSATATAPQAQHPAVPVTSGQAGGPTVTGPDTPPSPPPRSPLLEALAPGPAKPTDDTPPPLPGPFDPLPPRPRTPEQRAEQLVADREGLDRRRYQGYFQAQREWYEDNRRQQEADWLRERADDHEERASDWAARAMRLRRTGAELAAERWHREAFEASKESYDLRELAREVRIGATVPDLVTVDDDADFYRINDDVADLAVGAVETPDRSGLTGDDDPPPIDRSRRYGVRGGLRPPLALHQTDLERQMPRNADGTVMRTADPRHGGWFPLANDGGPQADPTRGINCVDCTLSFYETWMHGRPRVSAPRTFDAYLEGDVRRPIGGEADGPRRVEESTGGRFQKLCEVAGPATPFGLRQVVERGYRDLHEQLLAGGHGSYAFLITSWEGGGAHAWVALNQNGSVLYLDPQNGHVGNRPLYTHRGVPAEANVVGIDALVVGRDGRPMPLVGPPPGDYNALPDPSEHSAPPVPPRPVPPAPTEDSPDFNHVHLLGESTTFTHPGVVPAPASGPEPDPGEVRQARLDAHAQRISAGMFVRDALAASGSLEEVFGAGVTPVELANHLDAPTLRRLVPGLDDGAARDVTRLLGAPHIQQMLDHSWEAPPRGEPLLAETLVRQLAQRPDLVRMILATPELANSLTARPMTLHHLASHQQAIDVLGEVLDDISGWGAEVVATRSIPPVLPTPLTAEQRETSEYFDLGQRRAFQPSFDKSRCEDLTYRRQYLDRLYRDAAVAQGEINALGRKLADLSRGKAEFEPRPRPKDRQRAEDKIADYDGDASRLKDLAAGRVSYQRVADVYVALRTLRDDPDIEIVQFKDRFVHPQASGYRDIQMMVRTSSGHIAEFRLQLAALDGVAHWEHALFEVTRDLEAVAAQQGRSLSVPEAAVRNGVLQRQREHFWEALRSTLGGGSEQ
ncbi:MAG: toxin glutamine deamidase domain-containing protein [Micromonospora sp.]